MTSKSKENLYMIALQYLKNKIIYCELQPGSIIQEEVIADELKISRTPVREALLQLEREKYVEVIPRKSTQVAKFSLKDLKSIYEARLLLEVPAIRNLHCLSDDAVIEHLHSFRNEWIKIIESGDTQETSREFLLMDEKFHTYIISLSENAYLVRFCTELFFKSLRFWYLTLSTHNARIEKVGNEHIKIIDYLLARNSVKAAQNMETHILLSRDEMDIFSE